MSNEQTIILIAMFSAMSRSFLNLIDRHQFGQKKQSIVEVNLINNSIPTAMLFVLSLMVVDSVPRVFEAILNTRAIALALVIQMVAYAFSFAFRHLRVNQVSVISKVPDIFIPIALFSVTQEWHWNKYFFSIVTVLVCLPIVFQAREGSGSSIKKIAVLISLVVTVQAVLSTILTHQALGNIVDILLFSFSVIFWRSVIAIVPSIKSLKHITIQNKEMVMTRAVLTILTQVSFIYVVGNVDSVVAWPILNSTGLISLVLTSVFMKHERPNRTELFSVCAISLICLLQFLCLSN